VPQARSGDQSHGTVRRPKHKICRGSGRQSRLQGRPWISARPSERPLLSTEFTKHLEHTYLLKQLIGVSQTRQSFHQLIVTLDHSLNTAEKFCFDGILRLRGNPSNFLSGDFFVSHYYPRRVAQFIVVSGPFLTTST
jgi:hypothetical protein